MSQARAKAKAKDGAKAKATAQDETAAEATAPTSGPGLKSELEMKPQYGAKVTSCCQAQPKLHSELVAEVATQCQARPERCRSKIAAGA